MVDEVAILGESYGRCTVGVERYSMRDVSSSDIIEGDLNLM